MNKPDQLSPYFCVAPWTHTYLSPQGERRLCCASREKADYIKQDYKKDITKNQPIENSIHGIQI